MTREFLEFRFFGLILGSSVTALNYFGYFFVSRQKSNKHQAIDFYKFANGKNYVASLKTTNQSNVSSWINSNKQHLKDLAKGVKDKKFYKRLQEGVPIDADITQLYIRTIDDISDKDAWINAIKNEISALENIDINKFQVFIDNSPLKN